MLIHLVADYGHGDLAFAEVSQRLFLQLPEARLVLTPVPAFDTISAGFCVGQLALTPGPADRVVFHNVAPRADTPDPRPGNQGERFVCARLDSGVLVVGANAGYTFSFLRDEALTLREVRWPTAGSQFRSIVFVRALATNGLVGSMGRVGACGDNAAMESFFALLQKNVLDRQRWATREELRLAIITWIERTYHRRRRQRRLGRLTPVEYETLTTAAAAA